MSKIDALFSKSFRGFSPDEVIAYIDELNVAHRNVKAESLAKITVLEKELETAKLAAEEALKLRDELTEKNEKIASLEADVERITTDAENQRLAIVSQTEKIAELEEQITQLKSSLEAAEIKSNAMEQNSKEYESMLADVDSILASSRRKAMELVEEAEKRADMIIKAAEDEAKEKSKEIISKSDEHLNDNLKKVKYLYRRQDELAELFKEHKNKVDSFFASLPEVHEKH